LLFQPDTAWLLRLADAFCLPSCWSLCSWCVVSTTMTLPGWAG